MPPAPHAHPNLTASASALSHGKYLHDSVIGAVRVGIGRPKCSCVPKLHVVPTSVHVGYMYGTLHHALSSPEMQFCCNQCSSVLPTCRAHQEGNPGQHDRACSKEDGHSWAARGRACEHLWGTGVKHTTNIIRTSGPYRRAGLQQFRSHRPIIVMCHCIQLKNLARCPRTTLEVRVVAPWLPPG